MRTSLGWVVAVALLLPGGVARPVAPTPSSAAPAASQASTTPTPRSDPERTIAGVVVIEHGWAAHGATVSAYRLDAPGDRPRGASARPVATVFIWDAQGRFELHGLAEGDYRVVATLRGYSDSEVGARAGTADVRIELHEGPFVRGRVLGADGAPVKGFTLNQRFIGTPDGRFQTPTFGGGEMVLHIEAEGYVPLRRKVRTSGDASIDVGDLQLVRGRTSSAAWWTPRPARRSLAPA